MKWFDKLSDSERKLIKIGAFIISISVIWAFVYKPIVASIDSNKTNYQILLNQIQEMNEAAEQIALATITTVATRNENQPFISWIDDQLVKSNLSQFVARSEPKDNQTLILLFENIVFDDFISWLEPLVSTNNIVISEADVNIMDRDSGLCNIRITLIENQ
jgi:type II secretory pathway component PulM